MLTCYFCKTLITKLQGKDLDSLAVHHIDGNHSNDVPENRANSHRGCHSRYHINSPKGKARLRKWNSSPEGKAHAKKLGKDWTSSPEGKAHLKKWHNSPEGKAHLNKLHMAQIGKPRSEEHKQAMRDGWKKRHKRLANERLEENWEQPSWVLSHLK